MTGQQAAQRKNSPRQWGRPFGRVPREICPAISTHPRWGGDCTTTIRWQDAGAGIVMTRQRCRYFSHPIISIVDLVLNYKKN